VEEHQRIDFKNDSTKRAKLLWIWLDGEKQTDPVGLYGEGDSRALDTDVYEFAARLLEIIERNCIGSNKC
jgi:hypothetical protein